MGDQVRGAAAAGRGRRQCLALGGAFVLAPGLVAAQAAYPNRPIRLIVPFAPGGSSDATARMVADGIQRLLGQPVVADNQGGASGIIGTLAASRAAPDGYTLMFSTSSNHVIAPLLRHPRPYDPIKDFTPISSIAVYDGAFIVSASVTAKTIAEFVASTHSQSGRLNYGSAGIGSTNHLSMEQFKSRTGAELLHVPYKGSAAAILAVAANEVQATIDTIASAMPLVKAGKVRMLAVNTARRSPLAPDVPTFRESGVKDIANYWQGISGPAGLPKEIVALLNRAVVQSVGSPEFLARLAQTGATPTAGSAESFATSIEIETANWAEVIRVGGIRVD